MDSRLKPILDELRRQLETIYDGRLISIAAFGQNFARSGRVPAEYHRHLIQAQALRHAGDYGQMHSVTREQAQMQIEIAAKFIALAVANLGSAPSG